MRRNIRFALLFFTLLTMSAGSFAPAAPAEESRDENKVLLRYEFREGQVYEYDRVFSRSRTSPAGPNTTIELDASVESDVTVLPVEVEGDTHVLVNKKTRRRGIDRCIQTVNGRPRDVTLQIRMQLGHIFGPFARQDARCAKADGLGGVFGMDMWSDGPMASIAAVMDALALPEKPVRKGDTWKRSRKFGRTKVAYEYVYKGIEKKDGVECHHIEGAFDMVGPEGKPVGGKEIKAQVSLWVSVKDPHPVAVEASVAMGDGGNGDAAEKLSLRLVKIEKIAEKQRNDFYAPVRLNVKTTLALQDNRIKEAWTSLEELQKKHAEYRFAKLAEGAFRSAASRFFEAWRDAVLTGDGDGFYKKNARRILEGGLTCANDEGTRKEAYNALMLLAQFEKVPFPLETLMPVLMEEKSERVRAAAAMLMAQDIKQDEDHLAAAVLATLDSSPVVRRTGMRALGGFADRRAAEALAGMLEDKVASVRETALQSLQRLTGRDFGPDKDKWTAWLKAAKKLSPSSPPKRVKSDLERLVGEYLRADEEKAKDVLARIKEMKGVTFKGVSEALRKKPHYRQMPVGMLSKLTVQTDGTSKGAPYSLYVPEDYAPGTALPVIVALVGGIGTNNANFAAIWAEHSDGDFIILAPSTGGTKQGIWWNSGKYNVIAAIEETVSRYNVDTDRIYITGHSNGGIGAWHIAARFPDIFAGLAPNAGHAGGEGLKSLDNAVLENLIHVPTLVQHGARDPVIPLKNAEASVARMKEFGCDVEMITYPNLSHRLKKTGDGRIVQFLKIVEFARGHNRDPFPKRVVFKLPNDNCASAYWLASVFKGKKPGVEGEIKGGNLVEIKTNDVKTLTVRLSDEMVNLNEEVTIRLNGVEVFSGKVERSIETLLKSARETGDVRRAWAAEMTFQVE